MNTLQEQSAVENRKGEFLISTDKGKLDLDTIYSYLSESYWAKGIPREVVVCSVQNSLCFGIFAGAAQIGFARVITDFATYAYLADVFVLEAYRGRGLSKWLMECIVAHPQLQGLRRWTLATRDAHKLYEKFGFKPLAKPDNFMELHNPEVYSRNLAS
ncbi:MAG TPA: GNAT family N-acetyltransferase [Terriglobales bacterium]|jgi:ribosomal protein S18 acetylase RimI-like enzyme